MIAKIAMEMRSYNPLEFKGIMLSEEGNKEDVSVSVKSLIVPGSTFSTEKNMKKNYQ